MATGCYVAVAMMVNNWGAHFSPPAQLPPGWHYHLAPTFLHQLTNHFYNMGQIVEFSKLLLPIGPQWVGWIREKIPNKNFCKMKTLGSTKTIFTEKSRFRS